MRALRIGLILLVIFGGLFVGADRIAVRMAESEVAAKTRSSLSLSAEPDVSIKGFPFLTQLLAQKLDRVDLKLDGYPVRLDDQEAMMSELVVALRDVELGSGFSSAVAERAEGSGFLTYEELTRLTAGDGSAFGVAFGYAGGDQVEIRVTAMGRAVGPAITSDISLDGDVVRLRVDDIPSFENIPVLGSIPGIEGQIRERIDQERQIHGLPSGLSLDGISATEDGLELSVSGTEVRLAG